MLKTLRNSFLFLFLLVGISYADQYVPLTDSTDTANIDIINRSFNYLFNSKMDVKPANRDTIFQIAVGTFTSSGSTGAQSVTGVGFKPRYIIIGMGVGAADSIMAGLGWATATKQVALFGFRSDDTNTGGLTTNTAVVIRWCGTDGVVRGQASLTSFDEDGFTLNWSAAEAQLLSYTVIQ